MRRLSDALRLMLIAVALGIAPVPLLAATFTVDVTGDAADNTLGDGICDSTEPGLQCTFRAAIGEANFLPGHDTIVFNIGSGSVILAEFAGYTITDSVTIDGTMQTGNPSVVVTGGGLRPQNGIVVQSGGGGSIIRGLVVNGWGTPTSSATGIVLLSDGNRLEGNFIGTDVSGTIDVGNRGNGVIVAGSNNIVGGTTAAERNVISGNDSPGVCLCISGTIPTNNRVIGNYIGTDLTGQNALGNLNAGVLINGGTGNIVGGAGGVLPCQGECNVISATRDTPILPGINAYGVAIAGAATTGNQVRGNFIGTDMTGSANLGNEGEGVRIIGASGNVIGGTTLAEGNIIAHSGGNGVSVTGTSLHNTIRRNLIHDNSGLGIDLASNGVTKNDPRDDDSGPNDLINFPDGVMATYDSAANQTVIRGRIETPNPQTVTVEIYRNTSYDPTGHGEGETYVDTVMPNAEGAFCLTQVGNVANLTNLTATATDAAGSTSEFSAKTEVELIALEVIQTVQDWTNGVRLIKDKVTYVRAHLQTIDPAAAPIPVFAVLRAFDLNGVELPDPVQPAMNFGGYEAKGDAAARRATWNDSLNFAVPPSWLDGNVELRLEWVDGNLGCREPGDAGGPPGQCSDCRVKVTFVPTAMPTVRLVSILYRDGGTAYSFGPQELGQVARIVEAIYPIERLDRFDTFYPWMGTVPPPVVDVTARMQSLRAWNLWPNTVYYGVIPGRGGGVADGIPSKAASGYMPVDFINIGRTAAAHEIGHCLGREHSTSWVLFGSCPSGGNKGACMLECSNPWADFFPDFHTVGLPSLQVDPLNIYDRMPTLGPMDAGDSVLVFGLDTSTPVPRVVDPNVYFDLMSYCSVYPYDMWISKHTYEALHTSIQNTFSARSGEKAAFAGAQSFVIVRGRVDLRTGAVSIAPLFPLTTTVAPEGSPPGSYTLRLLDAADGLIGDIPFAPVKLEPRGPDPQLATFFVPVPANPAIRKVVVLLDTEPLATRAASANPPTVQVLSPNGGETLSADPVALSWIGTDPDGDTLLYLVQFSPDGGATWETLLVDHPAQTASMPRRAFKGTANGLIRVMVTDGFDTAQDQSDATFSVTNHAPFVSLWRPTAGEMFAGDQQVGFEASARDVEDGQLPGGSLQWASNIDGALGTGRTLLKKASQLSPGTHTITVTATDSATLTGFASVSIQVGTASPPTFADLSLEQSASPEPPIAGNSLMYTIQVRNAGRDTATGVTLSDTLPAGMFFVSANATQGSCGEAAGVVSCNLGSLAEGATATVTIVVTPPSAGAITNFATVSAGEVDPVPANNAAEWETTVDPRGMTDLTIEKTDSTDPVPLGGALGYTLQVTNLGGNTAKGPTVLDTLPPGTSFVAASGAGWSCDFASGTLTCTLPSLGVGPAPPIGIALTAPTTPGSIVNTASVSFADPDTNPSNNSATATTQVGGVGPAPANFYTLTPCRIADTREPDGAFGGPALAAGLQRAFTVAGQCVIPATAKAVSFNVTITAPTSLGHISLYPGGTPLPLVSTMNFGPGDTRANNAIIPLGVGGTLAVTNGQSSGTVHLILDVVGYFE